MFDSVLKGRGTKILQNAEDIIQLYCGWNVDLGGVGCEIA
jgi:hypothetical protein